MVTIENVQPRQVDGVSIKLCCSLISTLSARSASANSGIGVPNNEQFGQGPFVWCRAV